MNDPAVRGKSVLRVVRCPLDGPPEVIDLKNDYRCFSEAVFDKSTDTVYGFYSDISRGGDKFGTDYMVIYGYYSRTVNVYGYRGIILIVNWDKASNNAVDMKCSNIIEVFKKITRSKAARKRVKKAR